MEQAITPSVFNALERVTGAHACITTDHALIHNGQAFTLAGTMSISTGQNGGLFLAVPNESAAAVTINMTAATSDLTYTAVTAGADGNSINVTHVDPGAADAVLAVSVFVKTITVSLATNGAGAITSTAAQVKAAVNAHAEAAALVTCEDEGAGSGVVNAVANTFLTGGASKVYCHFKAAAVRSNAAVSVSLLEGYIKAGGDTVSALTPANRNRISSNTSRITATGGTNVTPTQEAVYATLATAAIGANLPAYKVGGDVSQAEEWVLEPGVNYCVAVANSSGSTALVSYDLFWYEESGA